jgi:VWFA-related protein
VILALLLAAVQAPDFRSGVTLVRLDVRVTRAGQPVAGLAAADFTVRDEGRVQPLRHFSAEPMDLDLVLLLDTSGSMRRAIAELGDHASRALETLRRGDRVAVVTFGARAAVQLPWTEDFAAARAALARILTGERSAATGIGRAVTEAAALFAAPPRERRRAILAITDNRSAEPPRAEAAAVRAALAAEAVVEAIVVPTAGPLALGDSVARSLGRSAEDVRRIADKTGGEWRESAAVPATLGAAIARLRSGYALYYAAPESRPGQFRRIRVHVRSPGAAVRHRPGYVAR